MSGINIDALSAQQKHNALVFLSQWDPSTVQAAVQQVMLLDLNPIPYVPAQGAAAEATTKTTTVAPAASRKRALQSRTTDENRTTNDPPTTDSPLKRKRQRNKERASSLKKKPHCNLPKAEQWQAQFENLKRHWEETGVSHVPISKNPQLGRWCDNQRQAHKRYLKNESSWLDQDRIDLLNSVEFRWNMKDKPNVPLEVRLKQMQDYRQERGHLRVPMKGSSGLGTWINQNRSNYQHKKMSQEHFDALDKAGFEWKSPFPNKNAWEERMHRLVDFKKQKGHCNVPNNYPEDLDLPIFVRQIRHAYQVLQNNDTIYVKLKLTDERMAALVRLGFVFGGYEAKFKSWDERYEILREFQSKNGHCHMPKKGLRQYKWVIETRKHAKDKLLPKEKIEKLEAIGFFKKTKKINKKWVVVEEGSTEEAQEEEENK